MIVTISKSELARAIDRPCKVASRQKDVHLACVLMRAKGESLVVEATDLNESCRCTSEAAMVMEDGEALVSARVLSKVVKTLPEQPVEMSGDKHRLSIVCGRSSFDVPALDPADFAGLLSPEDGQSITVPADDLKALVDRTAYAAKKEKAGETVGASAIQECVHLSCRGGVLTATATDSYRVARASCEVADAPDFTGLVNARMLSDFLKTDAGEVTIAASDATVGLFTDSESVISRAYTGKWPEAVERVLAVEEVEHVVVGRGELCDALGRAAAIEGTGPVELAVDEGGMTVTRKSDNERMSESLKADSSGLMVIGCNVYLLLDAAKALPAGSVSITMSNPIKPFKLESGGTVAVVMPVRLGQA